jgi:DNA-binding NarL/FixJ family response regulator
MEQSACPRVLLVDDNEAMLARARAVLTPECIVVGMVKDGLAALQQAAALQPDVIVLDISMPEMSGLEVAVRLRAAGSTAALVFLTVHEGEAFLAAATASGVRAYVVKPRLASDLPLAVQEAWAGRPFVSRVADDR